MNPLSTVSRLLSAVSAACLLTPALSDAQALVLEEIIVTAQKKSESLADTPVTVNVVTGDQMNAFANFSFQDLDRMLAGVSVTGTDYDTNIAVRGLGTNLNAPISPRVTVYLDGAFVNQERGLFSGLFDLERFELLRGPQGTLYGKSSPAGALTIQSRNPSMDRFDGYIQQSFAERDASNTQVAASIPLVENVLGLRVAGLYDQNQNADVSNITLGNDNENETRAGRAVLYWQAGDSVDLRLAYHYIKDEFDIDLVVEGAGLDFDDRKAVGEFASSMENETKVTVMELNWALPNDWVFSTVASHQDNQVDRIYDIDGSEIRGTEQAVLSSVPDVVNLELRLASVGNSSFWDWTAGLYWQEADSETPVFNDTFLAPVPGINVVASTSGPAILESEDRGAFLHNAFHLSERSTLTLGIRYSEEEGNSVQNFTTDVFFLLPDDSRQGPLLTLEFPGIQPEDQDSDDDAWTGTAKYQFSLSDDLIVYGSYDRGWRAGSANISGQINPPSFGAFDSETSDNVELGFKWAVFDGRGLWSTAAYYQLYNDFQFQADTVEFRIPEEAGGGVDLASPVVNVDEVEVIGVETELSVLLAERWTMGLAASYNQTEFSDADDVPCTTGEPLPEAPFSFNTCDLTGERAGQLPEWSLVLNSEYAIPIGSSGMETYARGLLKAESEYYSQAFGRDLDDYVVIDLFLGLRSPDHRWDVSLWVKNLFDESALLGALPLEEVPDYVNSGTLNNPYTHITSQLQPRTAGITALYRFGQ